MQPKKATVEFGVEVTVKSGKLTALIVEGEGKGNLKITLEWGGWHPRRRKTDGDSSPRHFFRVVAEWGWRFTEKRLIA